ncbi:hypothetical protein F7725_027492 [Dissostichus mawsoni]|uniref:Uncharacterized protein n=1 Tax=Dissostichus mawsoni TaxID=36200 RepID=A0A7J5XD54_DISMA|nr:hypothetical protein F7725_027492 [Dissostichus mawsoni]
MLELRDGTFRLLTMVPTDFKALIQRFYQLQSERVETYQLFDEQLVHEITLAFNGISKEVLDIKEKLHNEFDRPALSEHMDKLQSKEKQKLEMTAKLQLARQRAQDHPEDEDCQEQIQEIKQEIIKNKEALSEIMQDFKYDSEDHTLHWSYSLIDMPLQPDACLRTQPKNCLSSRRRVEFCSPGFGSQEPLCSLSVKGGGGGGGDVLTADGSGGGGRMAPVTPDAGLPGAIDAHWVASHLDKINGPGSEACQPT